MTESFRRPLACLILGLVVASGSLHAAGADTTISNGVFWKDTAGTPIYSQGGGILRIGARYYWYGVKYAEAVTMRARRDRRPTSRTSARSRRIRRPIW